MVVVVGTSMAGFVSPEIGQQIDRGLQFVGLETSIFTRKDRRQSVIDAAYNPSVQTTPQSPSTEETEVPQPPTPSPVGNELTDEQAARKELATEIAQSVIVVDEIAQEVTNASNLSETEIQAQSSDPATEAGETGHSDSGMEEPIAFT